MRGRRAEPASCHASPELTLTGVTHPLPPPVPLKPLRVLRYCRLALIAIILRQTVHPHHHGNRLEAELKDAAGLARWPGHTRPGVRGLRRPASAPGRGQRGRGLDDGEGRAGTGGEGPRHSSGRRGVSAGRSRGGARLRAECVRCAKPVGRQAGGRRGDEACGIESRARCPDTGHSRTEDIGQTVWSACAWPPAATGHRGPAERRGNVGGRTADDSFEARTDTAAAGRLARHPASGDVPTPIRPVARPGSPSPSPGPSWWGH